jgi:hypothetical protein
MAGLVLELQRDAIGSQIRISDLLRKALFAARKLGVLEFQVWIDNELNGYKKVSDIPDYRTIHGILRARNPYHGWIPIMVEDSEAEREISNILYSNLLVKLKSGQ